MVAVFTIWNRFEGKIFAEKVILNGLPIWMWCHHLKAPQISHVNTHFFIFPSQTYFSLLSTVVNSSDTYQLLKLES